MNKDERAHQPARELARVAAKIDLVEELVAAYAGEPGDSQRQIRAVEDLYEDPAGLPG